MKLSHLHIVCWLLIIGSTLYAQDPQEKLIKRLAGGQQVKPDEMVSFKSDYSYARAIQELSLLSKKFAGKIIVDTSPTKKDETKTIGANIEGMHWKDALEVIIRQNENWYEETPEYFLVFSAKEGKKDVGPTGQVQTQAAGAQGAVPAGSTTQAPPVVVDSAKIYASTKEITISAVMLEINQTKLRESGLSFSIFRGSNVNLGFEFTGASSVSKKVVSASISPTGKGMSVDVNAAISFFETEGYGEVISRPVVRVRSGGAGMTQVGQDFSVITKDFSGNPIQTFYHAGTMLNVSPRIWRYNDIDFIDLNYTITKSVPNITSVSTLIDKQEVSGKLLMMDGEKAYVTGLITSNQLTTREGIPFLKDLPWWVFGLRYVFGYDQASTTKKELIVFLEAKIEPTVEERAANQLIGNDKILQERINKNREEVEKRKKQIFKD
jgi:general secretion pathway protein D